MDDIRKAIKTLTEQNENNYSHFKKVLESDPNPNKEQIFEIMKRLREFELALLKFTFWYPLIGYGQK